MCKLEDVFSHVYNSVNLGLAPRRGLLEEKELRKMALHISVEKLTLNKLC